MTIKTRLALGAATSALLMLCSCGGEKAGDNSAANDMAAVDPGDVGALDPEMTANTAPSNAEADSNEGEPDEHGHVPEASENTGDGGAAGVTTTRPTTTTTVAVPAAPFPDGFGKGSTVWIPPPPPPPPPQLPNLNLGRPPVGETPVHTPPVRGPR